MRASDDPDLVRRWIHVAIGAGLLACVAYPVMVFVPMPRAPTLFLAASFGPALALASLGLERFLGLHRETVAARIAAIANVVAGGLVTAMLLVQLQVRYARMDAEPAPQSEAAIATMIEWVWQVILGLDVSFDVFLGLGTALFGLAMLRHPAFGRIVGATGIAIGAILVLGFNLSTMPRLPRDSGLFDPGPVTGAWYLVVTLLVVRARRWTASRLAAGDGPRAS